jgi:SAM-dependent methyltransferase
VDTQNTKEPWYAYRLQKLEGKSWKAVLDVQRVFRKPVIKLGLGKTLEIGCGIGRVLQWLPNSCGVDHNPSSVEVARARGLTAFTNEEFHSTPLAITGTFDAIIMAHLLEHLNAAQRDSLMFEFKRYLKPRGTLLIVCPQEAGFRSDSTHTNFMDLQAIESFGELHGFVVHQKKSYPFPRFMGRFFRYNEFFVVLKSIK